MKKGSKPLMVPLRREDRGIKDDAQFSPYMPSYRYIVFHDYGHPNQLGGETFRTKAEAVAWIAREHAKHRPGDSGTNVLGHAFTCDGVRHIYVGRVSDPCLAAMNFHEAARA